MIYTRKCTRHGSSIDLSHTCCRVSDNRSLWAQKSTRGTLRNKCAEIFNILLVSSSTILDETLLFLRSRILTVRSVSCSMFFTVPSKQSRTRSREVLQFLLFILSSCHTRSYTFTLANLSSLFLHPMIAVYYMLKIFYVKYDVFLSAM